MEDYNIFRLNLKGTYHASIASSIARMTKLTNYTEFPFPKKKRTEVYQENKTYLPLKRIEPCIVVFCENYKQGRYIIKINKKLTKANNKFAEYLLEQILMIN